MEKFRSVDEQGIDGFELRWAIGDTNEGAQMNLTYGARGRMKLLILIQIKKFFVRPLTRFQLPQYFVSTP